jgi:hypothetical protein
MQEDDPEYEAECKLKMKLGNPDCKKFHHYKDGVNWLCRIFGHKWPYALNVLFAMAAIEVRNNFATGTEVECIRCHLKRNLNEEIKRRAK